MSDLTTGLTVEQTAKPRKKKSKGSSSGLGTSSANPGFSAVTGQVAPAAATTTGTDTQVHATAHQRAYEAPRVEEFADEE